MASYAWHFIRCAPGGYAVLRDGRVVFDGEWVVHEGPVEICASGLHASWTALQALRYVDWDNAVACLVEVDEIVHEEADDKFVCRRRRIVAMCDADEVLRVFARQCALSVVHLWNAPVIVIDYLESGDEALRGAAWDAAWGAASAAAGAAARDAARVAAWAAAGAAARAAAGAAARDAARDEMSTMLESMLLAEMDLDGGEL